MANTPKPKPLQPATDPQKAYAALVGSRKIAPDEAQASVVARLQVLHEALTPRKGRKLLAKKPDIQGLYIWGNVGRGKSMLMDLFFTNAPVPAKRRVHFHTFMQEVHARIHEIRKNPTGDPVAILVGQLAGEVKLLCFDELQATDVADATLLFRLFEGLFEADIIIVSTSNHPPISLYTGGVQRERFQKFITLIEEHMEVLPLSSPTDYRKQQVKSLKRTFFSPLNADAPRFIQETIASLAPGTTPHSVSIPVQGRALNLTSYTSEIAQTTFAALCEAPLGPADYLALAARVETLILTGIPLLTPEKRNEARRFVTLIDALYEHKVKLIATAAAPPEQLYPEGDGSFEFQRTVSRLHEMQSDKYLQ